MRLHGGLCSIPFDMQNDYFQNKKMFGLLGDHIWGLRVSVRIEHLLAWCSRFHSLLFDMQHDYF